MRRWIPALLLALVFCGLPACGDDGGTGSDVADSTADSGHDALSDAQDGTDTVSSVDTASNDDTAAEDTAGSDTVEADTTDTTVSDTASSDTVANDTAGDVSLVPPLDGFGAISGDCDILDAAEIDSSSPYLVRNAIDFGVDPYDPADFAKLSPGAQKIITDGNAGGSSLISEAFAYEMLYRCELATLLKTETEIVYGTQGKITDELVEIDGYKLGVSVTRAVAFPFDQPYTEAQARTLLEGKLGDILLSSANVAPEDAWRKQILSVMAYAPGHADSLEAAWAAIDPAVKADTIVVVTVTDGDDAPLY